MEILALHTGAFGLDGGAMFGIVPRPLWEKYLPADAQHRIPMVSRPLLVRDGARRVLIETGLDQYFSGKDKQIYAVDTETNNLWKSLAIAGEPPGAITDVVLTHLHFDHAGGSTVRDETGAWHPAFPNATYHVQRRQWEWAHNPSAKDRGSYHEHNFVPLKDQVRLLEGDGEILPGIEALVCLGHSPGMQTVVLRAPAATYLYLTDLAPTWAHLKLPWIMAYDVAPLETLADKTRILLPAAREGWIGVALHDPLQAARKLVLTPEGEVAAGEPVAMQGPGATPPTGAAP